MGLPSKLVYGTPAHRNGVCRVGGRAHPKHKPEDKAVERGVKMLLRAKIIDLGLHYIEAGEIPPYGMETLKGCYKEYEALGDGDHSVGDIVRRCETLKIRNG